MNAFRLHIAPSSNVQGIACIVCAGCLWGTLGVFVKILDSLGSTPALTAVLRLGSAFILMAAITLVKRGPSVFKISRKALLFCLLNGFICNALLNATYNISVLEIGVSASAVLQNLAPTFGLIFSALLFAERPTALKLVAIAVNFVGCVLAITGDDISGFMFSVLGLGCGIAAGICYSLTAIIGRIAGSHADRYAVNTYSFLFATVFLVAFMAPEAGSISVTPAMLGVGALYGLIPTVFAYMAYQKGLRLITESSKVPVLASGETVVAVALGALLFGEPFDLIRVVGVVVVLASIVMMSYKPKRALVFA